MSNFKSGDRVQLKAGESYSWYEQGEIYRVGEDSVGDFGVLDSDGDAMATCKVSLDKFELVEAGEGEFITLPNGALAGVGAKVSCSNSDRWYYTTGEEYTVGYDDDGDLGILDDDGDSMYPDYINNGLENTNCQFELV